MYGTSSSLTGTVDSIFFFMLAVSVFFLLLITALIIIFSIKYSRSRNPVAEQIEGHTGLEIAWTVIPLVLVMAMFYYGFEGFKALRDAPEDSMIVQVTGRMWDWSFRYENGKESEKLYVPVMKPVKLVLGSLDVNHSFFVPAFRVKEDAVPGRETYLWFKPQSIGAADIFCAEYCGQQHSYMISEVIVLTDDEFEAWYAGAGSDTSGPGAAIVLDRQGCLRCHSLDGTYNIGPTFKELYGSIRVVIRDGREVEVVADEDYLRRAILEPHLERMSDFIRNMPIPEDVTEEDLEVIIEYLKTLGAGDLGAGDPGAGDAR